MLQGQQVLAPDGLKAFDTNSVVTKELAQAMYRQGYRATIRYVRRAPHHEYDITPSEAARILQSGLALGIVQHVAPENWTPTPELGRRYGVTAAEECASIGLPVGVNVWCDLEGVKLGTPEEQVIQYLNEWWNAVAHVGYLPGLYVGFQPGVSAMNLYKRLKYQYYWAAYNLNKDQYPAVRNVCMQQNVEKTMLGVKFDPDICLADLLGNKATFLAADGWPER